MWRNAMEYEAMTPQSPPAGEKLEREIEQNIRDMFALEYQRNELNYALSGVERGEVTPQDVTDDMSLALSRWFVQDLLPKYSASNAYILAQVKELIRECTYDPTIGDPNGTPGYDVIDASELLAAAQARFGAEEGNHNVHG